MIKFIHVNMKKVYGIVITTLLLGLIPSSINAEPLIPVDFWCANTGAEFQTRVRYADGSEKVFIVWSSHVDGKSPQERCKEASRQFRINYIIGLRYMEVGKTLSGRTVVCAVKSPISDSVICSQPNVLFYLGEKGDSFLSINSLKSSIDSTASSNSNQSVRDAGRRATEQRGRVEISDLMSDIRSNPVRLRTR
jgi:hypothetical protein